MGPEFIRVKSVNASSEFIDRTLKSWLSGLSSSERKDFFNSLYEIFSATDAETLQDLPVCWIKNFHKVSKSLLDISPEIAACFTVLFSGFWMRGKKHC